MKKVVLFLLMVLGCIIGAFGQTGTGPVFPYNHPTMQAFIDLTSGSTPKGAAFSKYLIETVNVGLADTTFKVTSVNQIFGNTDKKEELNLTEGSYINSGYSSIFKKMVPSVGHKWIGFIWFYRIGTFSIPIIKEDCGNVLLIPVIRTKIVCNPPSAPIVREPAPTPAIDLSAPFVKALDLTDIGVPKEVVIVKKKGILAAIAAAIAAAVATYLLTHHASSGSPGGAPITPAVNPVTPPSGGPGGAHTSP